MATDSLIEYHKRAARREAFNIEATRTSPDRVAAMSLNDLMLDISEDYSCAGWLSKLEFSLWSMVLGGPRGLGMGEVTEDEASQLRDLSTACNGWWSWSDELGGEVFVSMPDWLQQYAAHVASGESE